jgi:Polyketide cyclase / dehydrase and lipid transport
MVHVRRTFTVERPPGVIVPYLADFAHATEWDPGTVSCTPLTAPPVRPGSRWRNVSSLLGLKTELVYELTSRSDDRVVLTGRNKTATSVDDIAVRPVDAGHSEITYDATISFNGVAKVTSPLMQLVFTYLGASTQRQMTSTLNALPVT